MKLLINFLFLISIAMQSFAATSTTPDFYLKWMKYPVQTTGKIKMQFIQRIVPLPRNQHFSIGEITLMEMPKEKDFSIETMQNEVRVAMGFKAWNKRSVGKAQVFEQEWSEARKFYRLYVMEEKDTVRFSVATFRMGYAKNLMLESEVVQRLFMQDKKQAYDWASDIFAQLRQLILPTAQAQIPGLDLGGLGLDQATIDKLLGGVSDITKGLNEANGQLTKVNDNWAGTNKVGEDANKNWAETNKQLQDYQNILKGFQDQAGKTSDMVDRNWKDTNAIIKDLGRPEKVALIAGVSAASAVLGASAMNMAIAGVKWGVTEIARLVSGYYKEKDYQVRLASFKTAREIYYATKSAIGGLESSVDGFITVFESSALPALPMETILSDLKNLKLDKELEIEVKREKLKQLKTVELNGGLCPDEKATQGQLTHEVTTLMSLVGSIESMKKDISFAHGASRACADAKSAIQKLIEAELELEQRRREMIVGLSAYIEDLRRKQVKISNLDDELNSGKDDARLDKTMGKTEKTVNKQAEEQIQQARQRFTDKCRSFVKTRDDMTKGRGNRKRFCEEFYKQVNESMSEQMRRRTSTEKMNATDAEYIKTLGKTMQEKMENFYPGQKALHEDLTKEFISTFALTTQQSIDAEQANDQMAHLKFGTERDRKSSVDDEYHSNLTTFTESVDSAITMKKELEKEATGMETKIDPVTGKLTAEISQLKNTRVDRLRGKKQKINELCK